MVEEAKNQRKRLKKIIGMIENVCWVECSRISGGLEFWKVAVTKKGERCSYSCQ